MLGIVELGIVLGLLNLLFLAFVIVQVRYLFGGAAGSPAQPSTYAEYARRGFFKLVAVTALALPLLLLPTGASRRGPRGRRLFRVLAGTLVPSSSSSWPRQSSACASIPRSTG